ncbi:glycosyltransferase [Pengzhenrongella sp.]|uniref:glycosyltransferase n=1 Tax=Pengzhenrongella sp. TaxID=2888820 RepID=UPI002F9353A7
MRIAVVGPTHPFKGGVAQHTTVLAGRLVAAGHDVEIVSWHRQYPKRLYPGRQTVEKPEFDPFEPTSRALSWNRPDTWVRVAWRLRDVDLVIFAHITPIQVIPYRTMIATLFGSRARVAIVCHNVLPHERIRTDVRLVSLLLGAADLVVVHSEAQAAEARRLTGKPIRVARLAPFMPAGFVRRAPIPGEHRRLLFFGLVRPYKGLDVLLRALAAGPSDVHLRVVGEFWGGTAVYDELCVELGLTDRVDLRDGYVVAEAVPLLFSDVDALVLPYRSASGSQAVLTGFEFGVPVIATRAGHLADDVHDGVDGLVAVPGDVESLTAALDRFYRPGVPELMRSAVKPVDPDPYWARYLEAFVGRQALKGDHVTQKAAPPGGKLLHIAKRGAEEVLWARVAIQRRYEQRLGKARPLPSLTTPTDVLASAAEYERSVGECRELGLPLHRTTAKNWDALGAVSTVLNTLGTDIRVLDAGAARYSSILPWLRLYNVRELVGNNLEFTKVTRHGAVRFEPGDATNTQYRSGWFDAVTCMSVIEHGVPLQEFVEEAARILRPGGLLIVSTDYDQDPPDTRDKFAYGVQVKIFSPGDIEDLVAMAAAAGLVLIGDLRLSHTERPVYWSRTGLNYTFIRLAFRRK